MADPKKETGADKIDYDAAKTVVDREESARKDGVTVEKTDAASGIVMKPDPTDRSVRTYDPEGIERAAEAKPLKSKYESGEPVHDRS